MGWAKGDSSGVLVGAWGVLLVNVVLGLSSGVVVWLVIGFMEGGSSLGRVFDGSSFGGIVDDTSFGGSEGVEGVVEAVGVPSFSFVPVYWEVSSGILVCIVNVEGGSSFGGTVVAMGGVSGVLLVSG